MCNNNVKIKSRAEILDYTEKVNKMVADKAKESAERIIARNEKESDTE